MYEASGQWSTTHSQPSLTDGRGERRGGGQGEGWQGLHTNHSQINSLLPQSTIPPPFSLPHLSLSFPDPAPTFTSPSFLLSPPSDYSFPPAFVSATAPPTSPRKKKKICYLVLCGVSRFIPVPLAGRAGEEEERYLRPPREQAAVCALGQGV